MLELEGKVAIVTGAGRLRGIGRAAAVSLARLGANVVVTGTGRDPSNYPQDEKEIGWKDIYSTAEQIRLEGAKALPLVSNVVSLQSVNEMINQTLSEFGRIDILVNNAGINMDNLSIRMKYEEWKKVIDVNLGSTFLLCKHALKKMLKNKYGRIVNIT